MPDGCKQVINNGGAIGGTNPSIWGTEVGDILLYTHTCLHTHTCTHMCAHICKHTYTSICDFWTMWMYYLLKQYENRNRTDRGNSREFPSNNMFLECLLILSVFISLQFFSYLTKGRNKNIWTLTSAHKAF